MYVACLVLLITAAAAAGPDVVAPPGAGTRAATRVGLGLQIAGGAEDLPPGMRSPSPGAPCYLLLRAGRAEIEAPGALADRIAEARRRDLRVVILLAEEGWPGDPDFPVDDWVAKAGSLARRFHGDISAWQILERPPAHEPRRYAYLLKRAAVELRAADPAARIVSGPLPAPDPSWTEALFSLDAAPYLDALAVAGIEALPTLLDQRDRLLPRAAAWVVNVAPDPGSPASSAARAFFEGITAGAEVVLFTPPEDGALPPGQGIATLGAALPRIRSLLPPGMGPAAPAILPLDPSSVPGLLILPFFDPDSRDGLAIYRAAPGVSDPVARFLLRAPLETLDIADPESGNERRLGRNITPGTRVEIPLRGEVLALRFRLAAAALPVEEAGAGAVWELTAEEILASTRQFDAAQAARLRHYEARAAINIHYRVALLNTSVDILTENRVFVRGAQQDYVETALYVNGAIWRGKKPPYLPFLQPEKIKELPLEVSLDESYRYGLIGRDRVADRDCYLLSMTPGDPGRSLYEGRIWIDAATFARVRMDLRQTNLQEPLRSNHVVYNYGPVPAEGGDLSLPIEAGGEMVFEVLGQNLMVERRAAYSGFDINRDGFEDRLAAAYASGRPVFRDTPEGYFQVDREGGVETLRPVRTTRTTLLGMGGSIDTSGDPGIPLAGVDFFDFDFRGSGTQFNIAWLGPFVDLSWNNPRISEPHGDQPPPSLNLRGSFLAIERGSKIARDVGTGSESEEEIGIMAQAARASLSIPTGRSVKWTVEGTLTYFDFRRREVSFKLPPDTAEGVLGLRVEANPRGVIGSAWIEAGRRARWKPWGLPAPPGPPWSPDDRDFTRRGVSVTKSWYVSEANKITLNVAGFDGMSLDRFSRFELGDFRAARVQGFNGSGIHFDRGLVADGSAAFTLARQARLEAGLQAGWIHSDDDFGPGYERAIGAGLGLEFSGPWDTFVTVRFGHGISSTIADKGGGGDIRFVFYRTFNRWSRKGGGSGAPAPSR